MSTIAAVQRSFEGQKVSQNHGSRAPAYRMLYTTMRHRILSGWHHPADLQGQLRRLYKLRKIAYQSWIGGSSLDIERAQEMYYVISRILALDKNARRLGDEEEFECEDICKLLIAM